MLRIDPEGALAMRKWLLLSATIVAEVTGTLALRASQDHPIWLVLVVLGYSAAFTGLARVLRTGMPVGVAYGIWGAVGTALIAGIATVIFDDPLTVPIVVGIGLIIAGVLMIEFGSHPKTPEDAAP